MTTLHRGGLALVLTVSVLGVLGALSVGFVVLAQTERRSSLHRLHATQAFLLARSGLEDALARLSAGQDPTHPSARFAGEDWDDMPGGLLSSFEAQQERFLPTGAGTPADRETCPVRDAMRPSFFVRAMPTSAPTTQLVQGRLRGLSGFLYGDRLPGSHAYALKIEDESAKINVNGGFLDATDRDGDGIPDHRDPDVRTNPSDPKDTGLGWNFQLARILDLLSNQPEVNIPGLGTAVLQQRPQGGWISIAQLERVLGTSRDLSPFLTTVSRIDAQVVHPNGYRGQPATNTMSDIKMARRTLALEEAGRPPVNLNAAPRPVLVALLEDVRGGAWHERVATTDFCIQAPLAAGIADAILAGRPFPDWGAFSRFCDDLVPTVIQGFNTPTYAFGGQYSLGGNLCVADLLKAQFNPNTNLAKQLPDRLLWKWIDKSDLTTWSTEGCLAPGGTFRITGQGRLCDPAGRIMASRTLETHVEAYRLSVHTTQADFAGSRMPLSSYLSTAPGAVPRTTGASASWNTWGGGRGLTAMTYPCPPMAPPASFDGWIALGTIETPPGEAGLRFLHHFDDGLDADVGNPAARQPPPPFGMGFQAASAYLQTDPTASVWPDPALPFPAREPNAILPDGFHSQRLRAPCFMAAGNLPDGNAHPTAPSSMTVHGVLSYWLKAPVHGVSTGLATNGAGPCLVDFTCLRLAPGVANNMILALGRHGEHHGAMLENFLANSDSTNHDRVQQETYSPSQWRLPGMAWKHVTVSFDTDEPHGTDLLFHAHTLQESAVAPTQDTLLPIYDGTYSAPSHNLAVAGVKFVLGAQVLGALGGATLSDADQVIDEFAILDFGDTATSAIAQTSTWALNRFREGRYYKGTDASFLSPVIRPSSTEVILLGARWTAWLPSQPRMDLPIPSSGTVPPTGIPALLDPTLAQSEVKIDLTDGAGTVGRELGQGRSLHVRVQAFGYRVRLAARVPDPLNDPVLETPCLDDIAFAWQEGAGPRILSLSP